MQTVRILCYAGALVVCAGAAYWLGAQSVQPPAEEPPPTFRTGSIPEQVVAQGKLEPAGGVLTISAPPGDQLTWIAELTDADDSPIPADSPLAKLASHALRRLERDLAKTRVDEAQERLQAERALAAARKEAAELAVRQAKLKGDEVQTKSQAVAVLRQQLALAQTDLKRLQGLQSDDVTSDLVSKMELEQQQLLIDKLQSDVQQAEAEIATATEGQQLALEAAQKDVELAELAAASGQAAAPLASLKTTAEMAETQLDLTTIQAPVAGHVLRRFARAGDYVTRGPLLEFADLSSMVCVAEVYDAHLQYIRIGDRAKLTSPALSAPLQGEVVRKSNIMGRPALANPNPLERTDFRTGEVVIRVDSASLPAARRFVNLQVNVTITPSRASGDGSQADSG